MQLVVKISDYQLTNTPGDTLITYSLGSCVGVSIVDPVVQVAGLLHCMLPLSKIDPVKAVEQPAMFVDTGLTAMLTQLFKLGCERRNLIVKLAGCSQLMDEKGVFRIGERNYAVARKILWKNDLMVAGEDTGGTLSRTVTVFLDTAKTTIRSAGKEWEI